MAPPRMPDRARFSASRWLASVNGDGRCGPALLAVLSCLVLSSATGDTGREWLQYERSGIEAGEYWRLLTGHWVHLGWRHGVLNALGLTLMWALFARDYGPGRWLAIVLASIAAIDAGLWFLSPAVGWYVGASGWLHGVLAAGALAHLRRRSLDGWFLALFLVAKLGCERWGALPFMGDAPVIVQAHLYGAVGGLLAALCLPSRRDPL